MWLPVAIPEYAGACPSRNGRFAGSIGRGRTASPDLPGRRHPQSAAGRRRSSDPGRTPRPRSTGGKGDLRRILQQPVGDGGDHPEGMAFLAGREGQGPVVNDAPLPERKGEDGGSVKADVFRLQG